MQRTEYRGEPKTQGSLRSIRSIHFNKTPWTICTIFGTLQCRFVLNNLSITFEISTFWLRYLTCFNPIYIQFEGQYHGSFLGCGCTLRTGEFYGCLLWCDELLPRAVNCVRFCFWRCLWVFCLCMKYLGNRWTDVRQIHTEDVFGASLGRVWRSRSKIKSQGHRRQKQHFRSFRRPVCGLRLAKLV